MFRYAIISFNFGNYDKIREPLEIDTDCDYLIVTDQEQSANSKWQYIQDKGLADSSPLYASFYVRYHPFKYTDADIVIVVDGSIQIKHSLRPIVEAFANDSAQIALMTGNYTNDKDKIRTWVYNSKLTKFDSTKLRNFMDKYKHTELGSLGNAFRMFKRSDIADKYNKHCWRITNALGNGVDPIRLDDVVTSTLIQTIYSDTDVFLVDTHILRSYYMEYCRHNSKCPGSLIFHKKPMFRGKEAKIHYFDPYCYPTAYSYKTEALLLTKYMNAEDLDEWLDWHLNRVKFDHVHIFDNESDYDVNSVVKKYDDKVSVEQVNGHPRQYKLYDRYIEQESKSEWVMPIDDDEYLELSEFSSIGDAIDYYSKKLDTSMIAVRWKHMFPKKFHSERDGKVLDYCTEPNPRMSMNFGRLGDRGVKTLVRRFGKIHYQETWENPAGGHVPQHGMCRYAKTTDGRLVRGCGIIDFRAELDDERIRLLHCRYKGYRDWMKKYGNSDTERNCRTVCDSSIRDKKFKFNELLPSLD